MAHDIVADALNKMINAKRAHKTTVEIKQHSKLLLSILALAKLKGYIRSYTLDNGALKIELHKLNGCSAIKPRFVVKAKEIDLYVGRYLPARDIGILIVSTNKGLMAHQTAQERNTGGSLLAYFY